MSSKSVPLDEYLGRAFDRTPVSMIVVNQAGVVYEKDFGVDTANIVAKIKSFNPNDSWSVVED